MKSRLQAVTKYQSLSYPKRWDPYADWEKVKRKVCSKFLVTKES